MSEQESKERHAEEFRDRADGAAAALAQTDQRLQTGAQGLDNRATAFTSTSSTINSTITALEQRQRGEFAASVVVVPRSAAVAANTAVTTAAPPSASAISSGGGGSAVAVVPSNKAPAAAVVVAAPPPSTLASREQRPQQSLAETIVAHATQALVALRDFYSKHSTYASLVAIVILVLIVRLRRR